MARARNIKPAFFMNEDLTEISFGGRLLFIGLWTLADREGRLEDRVKKIKMELFPADDLDIDYELKALENRGFILRYSVNEKNYIQVTNFTKHQNPHHKEVASVFPPPNGYPAITKETYDVSNELREAIFLRDGYKCLCCGATENLQIDHITPLSKGGNNDADNLQTLCNSCNSSKKDKFVDYRKPSMTQEQSKHGSSMNQGCVNESASCPTDSLNLIPDSLNLIPEDIAQIENDSLKPKKSNRKTKLTDDFIIPDDWITLGMELRPDYTEQDVRSSAFRFKNYHVAKGSIMASWVAAWRNWITNRFIQSDNVHKFPDKKPSMQANTSNINYREGLRIGSDGEYIF